MVLPLPCPSQGLGLIVLQLLCQLAFQPQCQHLCLAMTAGATHTNIIITVIPKQNNPVVNARLMVAVAVVKDARAEAETTVDDTTAESLNMWLKLLRVKLLASF